MHILVRTGNSSEQNLGCWKGLGGEGREGKGLASTAWGSKSLLSELVDGTNLHLQKYPVGFLPACFYVGISTVIEIM